MLWMTRSHPRRSNAQSIAAAAPSVAYPRPQQSRTRAQPTSGPGHPSGIHGPRRPTQRPVAFSMTENIEIPVACHAPIIVINARQQSGARDDAADEARGLLVAHHLGPRVEIVETRHAEQKAWRRDSQVVQVHGVVGRRGVGPRTVAYSEGGWRLRALVSWRISSSVAGRIALWPADSARDRRSVESGLRLLGRIMPAAPGAGLTPIQRPGNGGRHPADVAGEGNEQEQRRQPPHRSLFRMSSSAWPSTM